MTHDCIQDEHGLCFECSRPMLPSVVISAMEVTMRGGKRDGAGRPKAADPVSKQIKIMVTEEQHRQFLELGGSRWFKRVLAESGRFTNVDTVGVELPPCSHDEP